MEIEYKWNLPDQATVENLITDISALDSNAKLREIRMHATYFDTTNSDVYAMHGGLRVRRENEKSVCCLKLSAKASESCKTRQEFEVSATDISEGLRMLPDIGAPRDICERLLAGDPQPICETDFLRRAYTLVIDSFEAELALDTGEMRRNGNSAPIHELELEFLSGSQDAFHAFAKKLQEEYLLAVQPLSKLARAMAL